MKMLIELQEKESHNNEKNMDSLLYLQETSHPGGKM